MFYSVICISNMPPYSYLSFFWQSRNMFKKTIKDTVLTFCCYIYVKAKLNYEKQQQGFVLFLFCGDFSTVLGPEPQRMEHRAK